MTVCGKSLVTELSENGVSGLNETQVSGLSEIQVSDLSEISQLTIIPLNRKASFRYYCYHSDKSV